MAGAANKHKMSGRLAAFVRQHRAALVVMALLLLVRLMALYSLGFTYSIESDDLAYVESGIRFAQTGLYVYLFGISQRADHARPYVLIGLFFAGFRRGKLRGWRLKLLWIVMGVCTSWYILPVRQPVRAAVVRRARHAAAVSGRLYLMDNLILTETPFMLALTAMVYYHAVYGAHTWLSVFLALARRPYMAG